MVRLIASKSDTATAIRKFQFQNGSINRAAPAIGSVFGLMFQFQNGSINRGADVEQSSVCPGFNSKMVRLIAR